ncbi:MAG: hypothetical protein IPK88_07580 [Saprospiraceae bacterium]|nr:hypothetical protein [Candidatus Defluviibacterium haderslevense]
MEELGNRNLFTSEFIIGCEFPDNKKFECIETLHNWINIKEKYYERKVYNLERTQYIAFLHIIDLKVFEGILNDLVIIYKKFYPDGEKADFIQHTFRYSLYSLEKFVNIQELDLNYYEPYHAFDNAIYYYNDGSKCPIIDFILESTKEIEHYRQFFKKIIQLINNLDFGGSVEEQKLPPPSIPETITNKIETADIEQANSSNEILNPKPEINTNQLNNTIENKNPIKAEISLAEKYLFFLNGESITGKKYLKEEDYLRLLDYTNYFMETLKLPLNIDPIKSNHLKSGELRYSFYLMFKDKYPHLDFPETLFDFLTKVFPMLNDPNKNDFRKTANYKRLSQEPSYWEQLMKKNK